MFLKDTDFINNHSFTASSLNTSHFADGVSSILFNKDFSPVREVVSRSNTHASGKWPSWKMGSVRYESLNEKNAFKLLDAASDVIQYFPQPCIIEYRLNGVLHKHTPDILVIYKQRKELWEVKEADDAMTPDVATRSELMMAHLGDFGYQYRVAIAEQLELNPRLKNIEMLIKNGFYGISLIHRELVRQLFIKYGSLDLGEFNNNKSERVQLKHICRLILEGMLVCDVNDAITPSTQIRLSKIYGGQ